jgi:hypothetical protein
MSLFNTSGRINLFSTPELEARFVEAIEKIAANSERGGQRGPPKPVECFVCKNRGKSVMINLKRKAKQVEGQSPFDLFNLDGTVHTHGEETKPAGPLAPTQQDVKREQALQNEVRRETGRATPTAAANMDQIMNYLRSIWPTQDGVPLTECGDHYRLLSPRLDREDWMKLAKAIREELGGEYVKATPDDAGHFEIRKPKP